MAVSLPTAADVRKVREQAAKTAAERAEVARTPLLAVLGAGDVAYNAAVKAFADARARAGERAGKASELPAKFTTEELRKAVDEIRAQAKEMYAQFAERGEKAWGKFRAQPQVKQAVSTLGGYTVKFDARVDAFVDDAHDVAEKALTTVSRQTRATGERFAQATKRYSGEAAEGVTEVTEDVSAAVADAGTTTADAVAEVGEEAATTTRATTRKAANRTRPATTTPKSAK